MGLERIIYDPGIKAVTERVAVLESGTFQTLVGAHTGDYDLSEEETGSIHTNKGATGTVTITLPSTVAYGYIFTFAVVVAEQFRIDPRNKAILDDSGQTADKYKVADAIGECISLCSVGGDWAVMSKHGTWTEE